MSAAPRQAGHRADWSGPRRLWGGQAPGSGFTSIAGGDDWMGGSRGGSERPSTSGGQGGVGRLRRKTPQRAYRTDAPPPPNPFFAQRPQYLAAARHDAAEQQTDAGGAGGAGQTSLMTYGWGQRRTQLRTAPPRFNHQGRPNSTLPPAAKGLRNTGGSRRRPEISSRRAGADQELSAKRGGSGRLGSRDGAAPRGLSRGSSSSGGRAPDEKQMWNEIMADIVNDGSLSGSDDEDWELSTMSLADYMEQLVAPQEISRGSRLNSRGSYLADEDCRPPSGPLDVLPKAGDEVSLGGSPRDLARERSLGADSVDSAGDPIAGSSSPGIAWRESDAGAGPILSESNLSMMDREAGGGSYHGGGGANGRIPLQGRTGTGQGSDEEHRPWEQESEKRMDAAVKQPKVRGGGVRELDSPQASPRAKAGGEQGAQQPSRHMRHKPHSARAVMEGFHRHLHARSAWADTQRPPSRQRPPPEALWLEGTTAPRVRARGGKSGKLSVDVDSDGHEHLGEISALDQQTGGSRPRSGPARVSRQRGESYGPPSPTKAALLDRDILTAMLRRPPSRQRPPPDAQGLDDRKPLLLSSDID